MTEKPRTRGSFFIFLFGSILLIYGLVEARAFLVPIFWALFFSILILPVCKWLEDRKISRGIAIFLTLLIIGLVAGATLYLLSAQVLALISELPSLGRQLSDFFVEARKFIEEKLGIPYSEQYSELARAFSSVFNEGIGIIRFMVAGTATNLFILGILPVYIFLILFYRDRFLRFIFLLYKDRNPKRALEIATQAGGVVQDYLRGMLVVTITVAVMALIVFLVLDVNYPLFFAIFVALFNLIPYIGVFLASTVSILYVLLTKDSLLYPILTLLLLWGIQLVENNLITPYIVGQRVRLNPLIVLLAIIGGGIIWGVSGMILFIPVIGAIKVIFDQVEGYEPYGYLLGDKRE